MSCRKTSITSSVTSSRLSSEAAQTLLMFDGRFRYIADGIPDLSLLRSRTWESPLARTRHIASREQAGQIPWPMRAGEASALVARLLRRVTAAPGGDEALALPQGYFGTQHHCLFPSIVSVGLGDAASTTSTTSATAHKQQLAARRALVTALALLAESHQFNFVAFYQCFWRDALLLPVARLNPEARSYVSLNRDLTFVERLRFMLALPRTDLQSQHFDELLAFLQAPDRDVITDDADWKVLAALRPVRTKQVTIELCLDISTAVLHAHTIEELARALRTYWRTPADGRSGRFVPMMLWFDQCRVSDPHVWTQLAALLALPESTIPSVILFYSRITSDRRHIRSFRRFVHRSLSPGGSSLRSLNLSGTALKYAQVVALFSALRCPNQLRELCLEHFCDAECNHRLLWAWIALGAFHADSCAQLTHLNLTHFHFELADCDLRDAVMRSTNPLRVIWEGERVAFGLEDERVDEQPLPPNHRRFVRVQEGTKLKARPNYRASILFVLDDDSQEYEVAIVTAEWVCVLVGGFGLGWVRSSLIAAQRDEPSRLSPLGHSLTPSRQPLRSLTYRDIADSANVVSVIQLLGDSIEALDLENSEIRGDDLELILQRAPQLAAFNFRAPVGAGIRPLLEHYRADRCRIATLELSVQTPEEICQMTQLLFSPGGRWLKRLHLYVNQHEAMKALGAIARVLTVNRSLVYLGIFTRYDEQLWSLFRPEHGVMLHGSLPIRLKLALLSVVKYPVSSSSSARRLDAGVLSVIFRFMAVPVRREIHIFDEYE